MQYDINSKQSQATCSWSFLPWYPKNWVFAISAHITLALALASTAISQEVSDRNRIGEGRLELYQDLFNLGENQQVNAGPRRAPNDPIDYSLLLIDEILQEFFEQTTLGCNITTHYCDDHIYRWDEEFRIKAFQEGHIITAENAFLLDIPNEYVLAATGISFDLVAELEQANLVLYLGSVEYLWRQSRQNLDNKAIKYFEKISKDDRDASLLQLILGRSTSEVPCYTSNKERSDKGVSAIYVTPAGLTTCYASALMQVLDLHATDLDVPSVTDKRNAYQGLTYFDVFAFELLYKSDAPLTRNKSAINALWSSEAMSLRAQLDEETLSKWQSLE